MPPEVPPAMSLSLTPSSEKPPEGEVLANDLESLNRLSACLDFEKAAAIFFENPAAFTLNQSSSVDSSAGISFAGAIAYKRYLGLSEDDHAGARLNSLAARFTPRPPKTGQKKDGQTFTREQPVREVTMQAAEFLFPEILYYLFKEGLAQEKLKLPMGLTLEALPNLLQLIFSYDLPDDFNSLEAGFNALNIDKSTINALASILLSAKGAVVKPLIADKVGDTDLAANTIISFHTKLDLYLQHFDSLKQR